MSINRCIVVVHSADEGALQTAETRAGELARFYAPLGPLTPVRRVIANARAAVFVFEWDEDGPEFTESVVFGAPLPVQLGENSMLAAPDHDLRAYSGPGMAVACGPESVRLITGAGPPAMAYSAAGGGLSAWSTHAVAAGYMALGRAVIDREAIPQLLAAQFVGGTRTMIAGVRALQAASVVDITGAGPRARSFWPAPERWQPVDSQRAFAHTEEALIADLPARLAPFRRPFVGLTGGLDSRVVLAALSENGLEVPAFTFEGVDDLDVRRASELAESLDVSHRVAKASWPDADVLIRRASVEQRWMDGVGHLGVADVEWPPQIDACLTGSGGETGRAFYYDAQTAINLPNPTPGQLGRYLMRGFRSTISLASESALVSLSQAVESWVADADALGVASGWRLLDLVYAEQRLHRWLRGTVTRSIGVPIPGLGTTEVQRGLLSMSLTDRLTDAFHRRFLSAHEPAGVSLPPDRLVPERQGPLHRARSRLALSEIGGRRRVRGIRNREPVSFLGPQRDRDLSDWLGRSVLSSSLVNDALGERWSRETASRMQAGDDHARVMAMWAAGPYVLEQALRELPSPA